MYQTYMYNFSLYINDISHFNLRKPNKINDLEKAYCIKEHILWLLFNQYFVQIIDLEGLDKRNLLILIGFLEVKPL